MLLMASDLLDRILLLMYIKINGISVKLAFLFPLLIICLGSGFMGRSLALFYNTNSSVAATLFLIAYIGGIYAMSFGLGGLIAAFVSLALTFVMGNIGASIVAVVTAGLTLWLGLYDTESVGSSERNKKLTPQEWVTVAATVAIGAALTVAIWQTVSGLLAGVLAGATVGSVAVFGVQLKYADTGVANPSRLLAIGSIASLWFGLIFGFFTYTPPLVN